MGFLSLDIYDFPNPHILNLHNVLVENNSSYSSNMVCIFISCHILENRIIVEMKCEISLTIDNFSIVFVNLWSLNYFQSKLFIFFFFKFCWTKVYLVATGAFVLDFGWPCPWVLKPGWNSAMHTYLLAPWSHFWCCTCICTDKGNIYFVKL